MHKCAETAIVPPVPPRRKKRKNKPAPSAESLKEVSVSDSRRSDSKRVAPPPPPPQAARRTKSRPARNHQKEPANSSNGQTFKNVEENLNILNSTETSKVLRRQPPLRFEDTDLIPTKETRNNVGKKDDNNLESTSERPFPIFERLAKKETNKYPPLFFTLHDFQNVMSNTLQNEEESRNVSSIESTNSSYDPCQNDTSFLEHSLDDENENEICFRVTTTNLPFEKCLDRWNMSFKDNGFVERTDDDNHFIFEDYIDRSNRLNIRRSVGPMCYDNFEPEEPTVTRTATKVRFVIESPSSSTPEHENGEVTCDSLQNIDCTLDDDNETSRDYADSVQLTEIHEETCQDTTHNTEKRSSENVSTGTNITDSDEFGDIPFSSVLKIEKKCDKWSSLENSSILPDFDKIEPIEKQDACINFRDAHSGESTCATSRKTFNSNALWSKVKCSVSDINKSEMNRTASKVEEHTPDSNLIKSSVSKSSFPDCYSKENRENDNPELSSSAIFGSNSLWLKVKVKVSDIGKSDVNMSEFQITKCAPCREIESPSASNYICNDVSIEEKNENNNSNLDSNPQLDPKVTLKTKDLNDMDTNVSNISEQNISETKTKEFTPSSSIDDSSVSNYVTNDNYSEDENQDSNFVLDSDSIFDSNTLWSIVKLKISDVTKSDVNVPKLKKKDCAPLNNTDYSSVSDHTPKDSRIKENSENNNSVTSCNCVTDSNSLWAKIKVKVSDINSINDSAVINYASSKQFVQEEKLNDSTSNVITHCVKYTEESQISGVKNKYEDMKINTDLRNQQASKDTDGTENDVVDRKTTVDYKSTVVQKRRIFVSESFRNIANSDEMNWDDTEDEQETDMASEYIEVNNKARKNEDTYHTNDSIARNKEIDDFITQQDTASVSKLEKKLVIENKEGSDLSCQESSVESEVSAKRNITGVPVNVRRNSFLETMLSEDSSVQSSKASILNCEIVAAHPKTSMCQTSISIGNKDNELVSRLNDAIKTDLEIQKILKESKAITMTVEATAKKSKICKKIESSNAKNAGAVKCDVLNELLSNFNNIKLKPVRLEERSNTNSECVSLTVDDVTQSCGERKEIECELRSRRNSQTQPMDSTNFFDDQTNIRKYNENGNNISDDSILKEVAPRKVISSDANFDLEAEDSSLKFVDNIRDNKSFITSLYNINVSRDNDVPSTHDNKSLKNLNESQRDAHDPSRISHDERHAEYTNDLKATESDDVLFKAKIILDPEEYEESDMSLVVSPKTLSESRTRETKINSCGTDVSLTRTRADVENRVKSQEIEACSEKTDEKIRKDVPDNRDHGNAHEVDRSTIVGRTTLELKRRTGSADKCAIVRRNPESHCNNNDNNRAVTPVAVSNDQSHDIVTITPGRVRSFVKYYEIRCEATTDKDSKINDRNKVGRNKSSKYQSVSSIRRGLELKAMDTKSFDSWKENVETSKVKKTNECLLKSRNYDIKQSMIAETIEENDENVIDIKRDEHGVKKKNDIRSTLRETSVDSFAQPVKSKRKKSVQFQGGFTVIRSGSSDEDDSTGILTKLDVRSPRGGIAPDRPMTERVVSGEVASEVTRHVESVDSGSCSSGRLETAAQIHVAADRAESSGINRFVSKPDTPRLVFYCTI